VMSLAWGPEPNVPFGEYDCRYGRFGRWGRALSDLPRMALAEPWSSILITVVPGTMAGAVIIADPHASVAERIFTVLGALAAGLVLAGGLLYSWRVAPWAWRRHWKVNTTPSPSGENSRWLQLLSRHWHHPLNVRCVVTDPDGKAWRRVHTVRGNPAPYPLSPGATVLVTYPEDFGAPPMSPGRYSVRWEMDAPGRDYPILISRGSFKPMD
jgi:hypothetical protein